MKMHKIIKDYFSFTRIERQAIFSLLALILLSVVVQYYYSSSHNLQKSSEEHLRLKKIMDSIHLVSTEHQQNQNLPQLTNTNSILLSPFNPNEITQQQWIELGVSEKLAHTIKNYTTKGGKFYKKTDLLKIYNFPQSEFDRLAPFIIFDGEQTIEESNFETQNTQPFMAQIKKFNPNITTMQEWENMGVPSYLAARIINYVSKGGKFKKAEDLLKIYGFNTQLYATLQDSIFFEGENEIQKGQSTAIPLAIAIDLKPTEINLASLEELMQLGFHKNVAYKIVNFRESAGGFYVINQVKDLYGMDTNQLAIAMPYLLVDATLVKKINLNNATFDQLKNHPYITDEFAEAIVTYRNTTGKFYSISEIAKAKYVSSKFLEKLKPYLEL